MIHAPVAEQWQTYPLNSFKEIRVPRVLGVQRFQVMYSAGISILRQSYRSGQRAFKHHISLQGQYESCMLIYDDAGQAYNVWDNPIGHGAYSQVYVGVNLSSGEPCAIKNIHSGDLSEFNALKKYLFKESAILNALGRRQGIVNNRNQSMLIQDFVYGKPLNQYIYNEDDQYINPFSLGQRLKIATLIIDAVQKLHDQGLMHRDLKPENVIYDPESEQVTLCDFGFTEALSKLTQAHRGSYLYAPVDHFIERVTVKSEVYSLGVMLCLLFTNSSLASIMANLTQLLDFYGKDQRNVHEFICSAIPELSSAHTTRQDRQLWDKLRFTLSTKPENRPTLQDLKNTLVSIQYIQHPPSRWLYQISSQFWSPNQYLTTRVDARASSLDYRKSCESMDVDFKPTSHHSLLFKGPSKDSTFEWFSMSKKHSDTIRRQKMTPCTIL